MAKEYIPTQDNNTLKFTDKQLEEEFCRSYDKSVRLPLRSGILISILSWYSALSLIYLIIPEQMVWLGGLTLVYIGSYFGFIIYATYKERYTGYYHLLGAISNAWAGLYTIYFCEHFPNGEHLVLPVIIFIIFFGSYMIRLRWMAGFFAALSYIISYQVYIVFYADLPVGEVLLYSFVSWMVLIFALLAGRTAENNYRIAYIQNKTIVAQNQIIEQEKELLLKEVHHRVQNNLQLIISLINLQMRNSDGNARSISKDAIHCDLNLVQGRVMAMSLVHQRINQSSNFSQISFRDYFESLKNSVSQQYDNEVTIVSDLQVDLQLEIEQAISLGLLLNEIMVAGIGCAQKGELRFIVESPAPQKCLLTFVNSQYQFPENHAESQEFELIEILAEQLEGTVKFMNKEGAQYELEMPYLN